MDERRRDEGLSAAARRVLVRSHAPWWARIASIAAVFILILLFAGIIFVWIQRRPIATHYLKGEFERRGVSARYHLQRVGLRTQEVTDLVLGDSRHPDLVARYAHIETRLRWNGSFEVYRIVARGVRLRGRLVHGRVSWGQLDRMLPPPSNKPFALPDFVVDVADSSVALATPWGPVGVALDGNGKLSGGFNGRVAVASPRLVLGRCGGTELHTNLAISVTARRPRVQGPVTLARFACPASRFDISAPTFAADATFNEAFTKVSGNGRMAIAKLVAGANGLENFGGAITYRGSLQEIDGEVRVAAQKSRLATIAANRTRLLGHYHLGLKQGAFDLAGSFAADNGALASSMIASVTQPLAAAARTPVGPVVAPIGAALLRTARNFNSSGHIRVVNFPGRGAARITDADVQGPGGARARLAGASGVTYYWPGGGLRVDSDLVMGGGGLPTARVSLRQPRAGTPLSGVADLAPYSAGGQRLTLAPIHFGPGPAGSTALSTTAQFDGPISGGRIAALRIPINGRVGPGAGFAIGTGCTAVTFNALGMAGLQLGPTRLPICPTGTAIVEKRAAGSVVVSAQVNNPVLTGRLGSSPLHVAAARAQVTGKQFILDHLAARLGRPSSPVLMNAVHFTGTFGTYLRGAFSGGSALVGKVPLRIDDASGLWQYRDKVLGVNSALTVFDRNADPRFYPLRSGNVRFNLAHNMITATGDLRHPATATLVTRVAIQHQLTSGSGHAVLDVPGLTFGSALQPEALTRLTEGVVALVEGTVRGNGRIDWQPGGKVTSTGDFSTEKMNLAAPFGPVTGVTTKIHFDDLLGLTSPPGLTMTVDSVNPGIVVNDGVIRYQLLAHNQVRIERGEWPFMGGRLILHQTVLDFAHHAPKHLTFELQGFNAKMFVDSLGFSGFSLSGTFDGELPMVFDENGGRIVGGMLKSRSPGGELVYSGTKPHGLAAGLAFNLLSDIRFRSMIIRLDGDLSGEFATRLTVDQVSLAPGHGIVASLAHRAFSRLPLKLNVNINGPFRALIQMAKSFKDPTQAIAPVVPFPIDSPALKVEVLSTTKNEQPAAGQRSTAAPIQSSKPPSPGGKK